MKILHISLREQGKDYASLRYFWENPADYKEPKDRLPLAEIKDLGERAETDYYTRIPVDYATTGRSLYNWLDRSDRVLANALNQSHREGLVIAIATDRGLAKLPWELLHDGNCFLVEKRPAIIPVRWVSNGQPIAIANSPQNRPLNLLFMATSPLGVKPELDYEAEEGQILETTQRTPVNLRVEESGCLTELSYVVREYERSYFDVFHLTGHATHYGEKPCFLTEDEYGNRVDSITPEIYEALTSRLPPLIFLSGCRTGYTSDETIPSMAEELLKMGGTAVLGWGERVRDTDATAAASKFYCLLSQGEAITDALSSTYQTLIKQQARDWHKLRLYVANILPQALVTPLRTKGRKQLPKPTTTSEFRDDEQRLRVAKREDFVGRRRQLQNCLRTLKGDNDKVGVLIHGMGGLGKSSIASRLWDRLSEHEKVLWWRQIDSSNLIKKLSSKLIRPELREIRNNLNTSDDSLDIKLANLFNQLAELGEKPFLLILDDFEWNLEPREDRYILKPDYILKPEVATILAALVSAIQETGTGHRILITCRYEFDSNLLNYFLPQALKPFEKAELTKKLNRLEHFSPDKLSEDIRDRALSFADGNPRLLEFLNNEVLGKPDVAAKLTELEQSPDLWKDKIIWEELYQLIDEPLQRVLSHCLIYEIPVPMTALEIVCAALPNYQQQLKRAQELGLMEISPHVQEENQVFRVSRILPRIIPQIRLPEAPKVYSLYKKAHEKLHQLWGNQQNKSQEKWQEIFRLLFADRENPERFRQGFYEMLAVQDNSEADKALESELRQLKDELSTENFCRQLEDDLSQKKWRKADEETAWIFYQVMVQQDYKDWWKLCRNFPSETLKQIDRLWVDNSQGRFGFSIQKKIWESVGGHPRANYFIYEKFSDKVGWRKEKREEWLSYDNLTFDNLEWLGHLPALWVVGFGVVGVWVYDVAVEEKELGSGMGSRRWEVLSFLAQRLNL
ncbi:MULTISPECIES: GUN4 domain-containing protein [Kamptonema]|uniref:GUN4 domain-containing protein n=1 Tax=Kamptonema TaxID=1501433 RepID=UPI0001DACF52|nr:MULTISPECIES: GUN4 domain-containing protein [Kamptonema]CBN57609.1 GUN4-like [Kamptonema sp. PCC 6506]